MLSPHTLEDENFPTCTHTYTALFGWGLSVLTVPRGCSGTPWGYFTRHSQSSCPQHKLRSESRQIFVRGKAQAVVLVTRDRKHHEAASPLTSKQHRQVSSLHIPPQQLQKPSSATTIFCHLSLQPVPYKGLIEYCWMSCL